MASYCQYQLKARGKRASHCGPEVPSSRCNGQDRWRSVQARYEPDSLVLLPSLLRAAAIREYLTPDALLE